MRLRSVKPQMPVANPSSATQGAQRMLSSGRKDLRTKLNRIAFGTWTACPCVTSGWSSSTVNLSTTTCRPKSCCLHCETNEQSEDVALWELKLW